ncbi:MAG: hypothetical protein V2I33_10110 [Kangiellaceae bacterium]|jgi:hypothetical protein|nr:hypothetical protein [Kangiellaceae bacterium]
MNTKIKLRVLQVIILIGVLICGFSFYFLLSAFKHVTVDYQVRKSVFQSLCVLFIFLSVPFYVKAFRTNRSRRRGKAFDNKILSYSSYIITIPTIPILFALLGMQIISGLLVMFAPLYAQKEVVFYKYCERSFNFTGGLVFKHLTGDGLLKASSDMFIIDQGSEKCEPYRLYRVSGRMWSDVAIVWDSYEIR